MKRFYNRELSVLDFQERVLAIAEDPNLPILERTRFLAIVAGNLDEFFQVRVAGLQEQEASGIEAATPEGLSPREQLEAIRDRCIGLHRRMERVLAAEILPGLDEHGIEILDWDELPDEDRKQLDAHFEREIYPMLTPLAVDPTHPFPYISNLSLNLAVTVRDPAGGERFARVKVPPLLPRLLRVGDSERFIPVDQLIAANLEALFAGVEVIGSHPFRVTRSADQAIEEDEAEDLLEAVQDLLQTRHRFSRLVRLEVDDTMPTHVLDLLTDEMRIGPDQVYVHHTHLDMTGLSILVSLPRPELHLKPWSPTTQPILAHLGPAETIFDRIRERDILVHLPYEAFGTSVGAFIAAAARDPGVVAIKQTLYRTSVPDDPALGGEQSIVDSLVAAARSGKQVVVLVELKARFDEEANIAWARMLEEAGVHVVYGVAGLKTHAKCALVVRREGRELKRYSHIGTGNYNPKTARLYEDLGLLTADDEIGADLSELFNALTGFGSAGGFRRLLVAPHHLRSAITDRIREEAAKGREGAITLKLNHLVDPEIIDELYAASAAGTSVRLIVRGICCLRPAVPGLSENITVRSLLGRHLEHSRVFRFGKGDRAEYLIGSSDLMPRNLGGRVEVVAPITHPRLRDRLEEMLRAYLADDRLAWRLEDDRWVRVPTVAGLNAQERMADLAESRSLGTAPDPAAAKEPPETVVAAGGLILRQKDSGPAVLLVRRPAYSDWTFPKGKVEDGESPLQAALREVEEETGFTCEAGAEVGVVEYADAAGRRKMVHYYEMKVLDGEFRANPEVDKAKWFNIPKAARKLTYERDRALLRSWQGAD